MARISRESEAQIIKRLVKPIEAGRNSLAAWSVLDSQLAAMYQDRIAENADLAELRIIGNMRREIQSHLAVLVVIATIKQMSS